MKSAHLGHYLRPLRVLGLYHEIGWGAVAPHLPNGVDNATANYTANHYRRRIKRDVAKCDIPRKETHAINK
jgi:hypothetical protein